MVSGSATGFFPAVRLVHSLLKKKKKSVVILNSSLHYKIFQFDIIQKLVWIIDSTCIQKRRHFEAKVTCQLSIFSLLHEIHIGVGVVMPCHVSSPNPAASPLPSPRIRFIVSN